MRVGFLSDLHADHASLKINRSVVEEGIYKAVSNANLDVLIISGDLSSDWVYTITLCELIEKKTNTRVYAVPGNHDLWHIKKQTNAVLEGLSHHPSILINRFIELTDEWDLFGGLGWYDYSFHIPGTTPEIAKQKKKSLWVDDQFIDFGMSDPDFSNKQITEWEELFKGKETKKIIFAQHVIPRKEFITNKENQYNWNFCNAYMGSSSIGKFIKKHPEIKISSFGHTHTRFGSVELDKVEYICNPVGYEQEWSSDDYQQEVADCLVVKVI
jgi:putative phosphoesterase